MKNTSEFPPGMTLREVLERHASEGCTFCKAVIRHATRHKP